MHVCYDTKFEWEPIILVKEIKKFPFGHMSLWTNVQWTIVRMDVCPDGQLSGWTIVRMDDCPDGRLSRWTIVLFPKFPVTRMIFIVKENCFLMSFWSSFRCITFLRQMCGIYNQNLV